MVSVGRDAQLHLCHLNVHGRPAGAPVLMVHGSAEDSRVFWSNDGHGLGPSLARAGYDVFAADLRGYGSSWPSVSPQSTYGYHQLVTEDLPALIRTVARRSGSKAQTWISHSTGGALLVAAYLRYGDSLCEVEQMVHFGARRRIWQSDWRRRVVFDLLWHRLGRLAVAVNGYFPARVLRLGSCDESARCFYDNLEWSLQDPWRDSTDDFDYLLAVTGTSLPRSLYFRAAREMVWSHPDDVRRFMLELGPHNAQMITLGREAGNLHDYDHLSMLLHPHADEDHFAQLLDWLNSCQK